MYCNYCMCVKTMRTRPALVIWFGIQSRFNSVNTQDTLSGFQLVSQRILIM